MKIGQHATRASHLECAICARVGGSVMSCNVLAYLTVYIDQAILDTTIRIRHVCISKGFQIQEGFNLTI